MVEYEENVLFDALRVHLQEELGVHRILLELAEQKKERIVAGDIKQFSDLLGREQECLHQGQALRRRREELLRRIADKTAIPQAEMRLSGLLERTPQPLRGELEGLQSDLVELLNRLREVNDRNMLLIRQSLGFVHDLMGIITGAESNEGYDQKGESGDMKGRGGLADFQA